MALHEFEGAFSYQTEADFSAQMRAILSESVIPEAQTGAKSAAGQLGAA